MFSSSSFPIAVNFICQKCHLLLTDGGGFSDRGLHPEFNQGLKAIKGALVICDSIIQHVKLATPIGAQAPVTVS